MSNEQGIKNSAATSNPEESRAESPYPEPPPLSIKGLFLPFGPIRKPPPLGPRLWKSLSDTKWKAVWLAVQMYRDSVRWNGKPWPGWEAFERDLAFQFAVLLSLLNSLPQGEPRLRLLELFLNSLNLGKRPGRPPKARAELMDVRLGQQMEQLWGSELCPAWNMKLSLEKQRKSPRPRLEETSKPDVVQAVLSRRATPESSIARVFAKREHISEGRARNALRAYGKLTGRKKFVPLV